MLNVVKLNRKIKIRKETPNMVKLDKKDTLFLVDNELTMGGVTTKINLNKNDKDRHIRLV